VASPRHPGIDATLAGGGLRITAAAGKTQAKADIALLFCALFLQRFSLAFGHSMMSIDILPAVLIFAHQFASGQLLIQYDRLLWFFAAGAVFALSLWLNFRSIMLPSFCELLVVYSLFTMVRPMSRDRYRTTLQGFQSLVALLSFLAIAQFLAQFVIDGREIVGFFGVVPDFLLASSETGRSNTIIPLNDAGTLIKSNGIFLTEPSTMSQIAALGILIEIVEFRRPRYLFLLALGLLLAYSGTGLLILILFLPLAGLGRQAALPVLLFLMFALLLCATGIIDPSHFLSRVDEFDNTQTSGFQRFISPFWLAADHLRTASLQALLIGSGPGTTDEFVGAHYRYAAWAGTWIKLFYEYGIIGAFVFICFLASCFRKSMCSGLIAAAIALYYIFLGGLLLNTSFLIMAIVLCTLYARESQRDSLNQVIRTQLSLAARSAAR
jgi:hypothetical protein